MNTISVGALRPGDLLLHDTDSDISKLIQWVSDSDYSHVAMVFEPGLLAEAISGGVFYDHSAVDRIAQVGIGKEFIRIDVVRPVPDPIPAPALKALQDSARRLQGAKFALNQMLELGIIAAVRQRTPPNPIAQAVLTWVFDKLVPDDPSHMVCSEFVYRAFADCGVPGLVPQLAALREDPAPREFPHINWLALWKEYEKARANGGDAPPPPDLTAAFAPTAAPIDDHVAINEAFIAARSRARERVLSARPARAADFAAVVGAAAPNPELVLPQDLADSPTFRAMGQAGP